MELGDYAEKTALIDATELDKVKLIAFYLLKIKNKKEFTLSEVIEVFDILHLSKPNMSRLKDKIVITKSILKGSDNNFKLHAKEIRNLELEYPQILHRGESVISEDTIIPTALTSDTRGFIELLARQINACYQFNIFDGCAILMRRLLEILLILTFENLDISDEIRETDNSYVTLENIIKAAKQSKKISLSKDSKATLDIFRELGNYSAHKIYYNARLSDIDQIKLKYRASIEELLYKAGLSK